MTLTEPSASTENEVRHELHFERPPMQSHSWRQQGMRITCIGCGIDHGFFVKPNVKLIGQKDGEPVFETLPQG